MKKTVWQNNSSSKYRPGQAAPACLVNTGFY
jgi:hypothetical protein